MAVVSNVPTEILTEIFHLLCKKPIYLCELNNLRWKEDFPWAVGLVCRQWRTAFLSYPPIWASLRLSYSYYDLSPIPKSRGESYAKEINRRLALYLERSGGYPLRLDIFLRSDQPFTMMALEMLSACSHRWHTAKFVLYYDWPMDSILPCKGKLPILEWVEIRTYLSHKRGLDIFEVAPRLTHAYVGPWAKTYGWILPWTQMTELTLALDRDSIVGDGDVPSFLLMLHNIKELHFRFHHDVLDFESSFPLYAPTPLNQLRVLEVPHPTMLSWFETPSLSDLYFVDYQEDDDEPLDIQGQISSLIQRSGCRIRKLSFECCEKFYVGTLKDVEELIIDYTYFDGIRSPTDISSLPKLRFLTFICCIDNYFESSMNSLTTTLKSARVPTRGECLSGTPVSSLERVTVELMYDEEQPKIPEKLLEIADKWPVVVFRTRDSYT